MNEINAFLVATPEELISELESLGPEKVRTLLLQNKIQYSYYTNREMVESWLSEQDRKDASFLANRAEERAEEALAISRSAKDSARLANKIAISAIIFSVITAIIAAIIQFIS